MASLRPHRKSKKQRTAKAAKKAAKGTAVYQVAKRTPIVKRIPLVIAAGLAALIAVKVVHGRGGDAQTA
jgi:hypothetical protein